MTAPARTMSLEEFLALEETKPYLEFINGEVVPKAMPGPLHSTLVFELIRRIGNHLVGNRGALGGTELRHLDRREQRVYLPDISVTRRERLPRGLEGPVEVTPDLAIEVLSPDDRASRVIERVQFYLRAGVQLLWLFDPERETVTVYRPGAEPVELRAPAVIDGAPVLPGFTLPLAELFAALHDGESGEAAAGEAP